MKWYVIFGLSALALLALSSLFSYGTPQYALSTIEKVETPSRREQGLSGRIDIPEDYGMLFVFPKEGDYGFWMKDMLVPIDIMWLSDTGTIVGIEHTVSPITYPKSFYPPFPVRYVLETRAGIASSSGWIVGTALNLPLE